MTRPPSAERADLAERRGPRSRARRDHRSGALIVIANARHLRDEGRDRGFVGRRSGAGEGRPQQVGVAALGPQLDADELSKRALQRCGGGKLGIMEQPLRVGGSTEAQRCAGRDEL